MVEGQRPGAAGQKPPGHLEVVRPAGFEPATRFTLDDLKSVFRTGVLVFLKPALLPRSLLETLEVQSLQVLQG